MYPWRERLTSWADGTTLHVDALGLVTLLGADEMDCSIGRLVPSPYLDYLPLLGAFVVAGNQFTTKKTGYALYNISAGIMTTELAGWFSRWLQAQHLHKVRSIVTWQVARRPPRWTAFFVGFLLIALPIHGMLIALTVLTADCWGFANVVAMLFSVLVKRVLVAQNQAGIDENIRKAENEARKYNFPEKQSKYREEIARFEVLRQAGQADSGKKPPTEPKDLYGTAKAIVITDDSKAVTIAAPNYMVRLIFATNPDVPNPHVYTAFRYIGWVAFAVHVVSIGMAALYTQICTVVLIVVATILTGTKVGYDDSQVGRSTWNTLMRKEEEDYEYGCWVSSTLKATVTSYPAEYSDWPKEEALVSRIQIVSGKAVDAKPSWTSKSELGRTTPTGKKPKNIPERRQDLYVWLCLSDEEDATMTAWGLMPRSQEWMNTYLEKKEAHARRTGRAMVEASVDPDLM
jgi:hypothetical protein